MSARARVGLLAALLPVLYGACERHVEEPAPAVRAPRTADVTPLPSGSAVAAKPWGNRCVRESPKVARRKTPPSPDPRCPADPETPPKLRMGKVTFTGADDKVVDVEIAQEEHDRERGLMYRKQMATDRGMIFWFAESSSHAFWMHNTCIPLDMLFIDADGWIVGIEENTPTISDDTFEVGCESKYVLELNAGWTRSHGVMAGQRVKIEGI